jgi:hypothetical protein
VRSVCPGCATRATRAAKASTAPTEASGRSRLSSPTAFGNGFSEHELHARGGGAAEAQRPATGDRHRQPATGDRRPATGDRKLSPVALSLGDGRLVSTSDRVQGAGTDYETLDQHAYAHYLEWLGGCRPSETFSLPVALTKLFSVTVGVSALG